MKRILLGAILLPCLSFAQLTYQDLKYLTDNSENTNIEFILNKGYQLYKSKTENDVTSISFVKYLKTKNLQDSYLNLRFTSTSNIDLMYYTFNSTHANNILNTIKNLGYKLTNTTYKDELCFYYLSTNYKISYCQKPSSYDNKNINYSITMKLNN